jgi:hypothetical protein
MNLEEVGWQAWIGLFWFGIGTGVVGYCECGNELLGSIKCGEFLDYVRNCQLLKKVSA